MPYFKVMGVKAPDLPGPIANKTET